MLDVPGHEPGHRRPRRARRVDVEPHLRGAPGTRRPISPGVAADGRSSGDRGALRGHPQLGARRGDGMKAIETITGRVSVLKRDDIDTDQIIPKQFLKRVERTGFGEFLFYDWAKEPGWELPQNPILLAGRNFGCGSSREHAPWGLQDYGFQTIIAPSFADIFRSNCTKIGLLPVVVPEDACAAIREAGEAQVDLAAQEVRWPGGTASFEIDPETKHRLLNGLDDIAMTLQQGDAISAYEHDR